MENEEILKLWKQYDEKLEKTLSLNQKIVAELQQQRAKRALQPAKKIKWITIVIGLAYIALLAATFNYFFSIGSIFFLTSIGGHLLVCALAVGMYLRQLILIHEIDVSESIVQIQHKLAVLKTSTIKIVALCLLQLPLFSIWNITDELIFERPLQFWLIQMPIVVLFTVVGVWLYRNIHPRNAEKKWFKMLFCGSEWSAMMRAGKLLQEVEGFENEN